MTSKKWETNTVKVSREQLNIFKLLQSENIKKYK